MANDYLTIADLATINDVSIADVGVSDLLDEAPLLAVLAAGIASNGNVHKYTKQTGAPVVGFRSENDGRDVDSSIDTAVTVTLQILAASFQVDRSTARSYFRGAEAYVSREGARHLRAAFFAAEEQILYGTGQDAAGYDGLADATGLDAIADEMVYDVAGTTAATASSVWLIRSGDDGADVQVVSGNGGDIDVGDTVEIKATGASGDFPALWTPQEAYLGLQIGGARSVARISNVTEDSGKTLTDEHVYEALALFPASKQPNVIAMSRRSLKQLRASRTATNATGAAAPRPTEVDGIPIVVTDAIPVTEAILT